MSVTEVLRGKPRFLLLGTGIFLELGEYLDVTPEQEQANFTQQVSVSGRVQNLALRRQDTLKVALTAPTLPRVRELMRAWRLILAPGGPAEFIRDSSRVFLLAGDQLEDERHRQRPFIPSSVTLDNYAGQYNEGGVAIDPANPPGCTRTNLFPNGDFVDTLGWTNDTTSTLGVAISSYYTPSPKVRNLLFVSLASGTKSAHCDFTLAGNTAAGLLNGGVAVSFLARREGASTTPVTDLVTVRIKTTGGTNVGDPYTFTPTAEWVRYRAFIVTTSATTATSLALHFAFSDDLIRGPVHIAEVQVEGRNLFSAFKPYSTTRTALTGSRPSAEILKFVNRLHYAHQIPAWQNQTRFSWTMAFWVVPHFEGIRIPGYVIRTGVNDTLVFSRSAVTYTVTLTPGQYTGTVLAALIQAGMRAQDTGNNYTVTFDTSTLKFTLATAGAVNFELLWSTSAVTQRLAPTMGFATTDLTGSPTYTSATADQAPVGIYRDGNIVSLFQQPAIAITMGATKLNAVCRSADGSTVTTTASTPGLTAGTPIHFIVSYQDSSDPGTAMDGALKISVNGGAFTTTTHDQELGGLGEFFWLGGSSAQDAASGITLHSFVIDAIYVDETTVNISDYYDSESPPDRLRNSWWVRQMGPGPSAVFDESLNAYRVEMDLIEDVVSPGAISVAIPVY